MYRSHLVDRAFTCGVYIRICYVLLEECVDCTSVVYTRVRCVFIGGYMLIVYVGLSMCV